MATGKPQRLALVVGIDKYLCLPASDSLRGAVRDAEEMADLLEDRFEFTSIRLLRDEEAIRAALVEAFAELVQRATPDTTIAIHWSGHGSRRASTQPEDAALLDETLVTHDSGIGEVRDFTDKELRAFLSRLASKGAFVTWIVDACHSGHLYRGPRQRRLRSVPPEPFRTSGRGPDAASAAGILRPLADHGRARRENRRWLSRGDHQVLLAACRADQEAYERPLVQGDSHGEWTYALLHVLRMSSAGATARQIADEASERLLLADVPQTPQVIGARDRLIFGVETRPPVRFIEVRRSDGARIELAGGRVKGLVEGSLWSVYPARTYEPVPGDEVASVRVVKVEPLSSVAETLASPKNRQREVQAGDRAFETMPACGEMRLGVLLGELPADAQRQDLIRRLDRSPVLWRCQPGEETITIEASGSRCTARDQGGFVVAGPLPTADPATPELLVERLQRRARWLHGLRLVNDDPTSRVTANLRGRLLRRRDSGPWQTAKGAASAADPVLRYPAYEPGELIALEIQHTLDRELYVYVLDFGMADDVTQLFPPPGGEELLPPSVPMRPGTHPDDEFEVYLPPPGVHRKFLGFLKVFATTHPIELDWLRTDVRWPEIRRSSGSLAHLLAMGQGPLFRQRGEDWGSVALPFRILAPGGR